MNEATNINLVETRRAADQLAAGYPALLSRAQQLAAQLSLGAHGRKRPGQGEEFWQYRPAVAGDVATAIDWRRSAKSDVEYIRQQEWQAAQEIQFWIDPGAAMDFASDKGLETKAFRAQSLGLATAILLSDAGERVGLMSQSDPAKRGSRQIAEIGLSLAMAQGGEDYSIPPQKPLARGSHAVFISDFLGPWEPLIDALGHAADQNVQGVLLQVLDPTELEFPFKGRTLFESVKSEIRFETLRANALRDAYLERLEERRDALKSLARRTGWRYNLHITSNPANQALLWLYQALEARR